MTIDEHKQAGVLIQQIVEKKAELEEVDHLISNVPGAVAKVKINHQWIVSLPTQALRGHAQARKVQLEQELQTLQDELSVL